MSWALCGGEEITTVPIPSCSMRGMAAFTAWRTQPRRASGIIQLPRTQRMARFSRPSLPPEANPACGTAPRPPSAASSRSGSNEGVRTTRTSAGTSASSEGAPAGELACMGATLSTMGRTPRCGRCFTNLSPRCTPAPPLGGQ